MAGNNKNINIKIKSQAELSGIDKAKKKINELGKRGTLKTLNNLSGTVSLIGKTFKVVTDAVGKAVDAVKEYIDLANKQIKAETQLEAAAKNNPYLNSENVKQLKNFASELQNIGTIGDEELLPLMAQLAASGRTQAEIQEIMSAALDVSASGAMSMESAVKNLNKTFSGLSGELGESIPQIKNLTQEQLKNGDAVKVVANQYKGMAEETTKASGTGIQLANALGDLKEQLGMGWAAITRPVNTLFTNLITKVGNAIGKVNELLGFAHEQSTSTMKESELAATEIGELRTQRKKLEDELKNADNFEPTTESAKQVKSNLEAQLKEYKDYLAKLKAEDENAYKEIAEAEKIINNKQLADQDKDDAKAAKKRAEKIIKNNKAAEKRISNVMKGTETRINVYYNYDVESSNAEEHLQKLKKEIEEVDTKLADAQKRYTNALKTENPDDANSKAAELIKKNTDAYYAQIDAIDKRAKALEQMGTPMSELEIQQEKLNVAEQSYIDLVTTDTSLVTTENQAAKNRLKNVTDYATEVTKLQSLTDKTELVLKWSKEGKDAKDELNETKTALVQMKNLIESNQLVLPGIDTTQLEKAIENINEAIKKEGDDSVSKFQEVVNNINTIMSSVSSGLSNVDQYFDQYADTQLSAIQNESDEEAEELKTQYENGIISYEEYLDKKDELDKKAAQKEYKIKLAQWQMDMATATVNAAQATLNALSSGTPPTNILNAVAAGLLGAAQVATVAANKPTAPSFATGGFLTGNSTQGDKIAFKGNAGEAILNASEQRNFMKYANGEADGQGINITMPINITNNASSDTEVSVSRQEREIQITIDKAVNAGFKNGTYTDSMSYAQSNKTGRKYL